MALSETTVIDNITVNEDGVVLYRLANRIFKDDVKIAESLHRVSLVPGQDLTGVPEKVAAICNAAWTTEVIDAYKLKHEI